MLRVGSRVLTVACGWVGGRPVSPSVHVQVALLSTLSVALISAIVANYVGWPIVDHCGIRCVGLTNNRITDGRTCYDSQ